MQKAVHCTPYCGSQLIHLEGLVKWACCRDLSIASYQARRTIKAAAMCCPSGPSLCSSLVWVPCEQASARYRYLSLYLVLSGVLGHKPLPPPPTPSASVSLAGRPSPSLCEVPLGSKVSSSL